MSKTRPTLKEIEKRRRAALRLFVYCDKKFVHFNDKRYALKERRFWHEQKIKFAHIYLTLGWTLGKKI